MEDEPTCRAQLKSQKVLVVGNLVDHSRVQSLCLFQNLNQVRFLLYSKGARVLQNSNSLVYLSKWILD